MLFGTKSEKISIQLEQVGKRIRYHRQKRGWTQQILADHSELTREHISAMENGRAEPGLRILVRIAASLDIRLRDLVDP